MKATVYNAYSKQLDVADIPTPSAGPGELLLKVHACGICGSDVHAAESGHFDGPAKAGRNVVFGHEYSGEVVALGAGVEGWELGDHAVGFPVVTCGTCPQCLAGDIFDCPSVRYQGSDIALGAYAEYTTTRAAVAAKIPSKMDPDIAALVEPLGVGLGTWKTAAAPSDADVLILGAGIIGLATAKWAHFFGARSVGISEIQPARLERARTSFPGAVVIDAGKHPDPVAAMAETTGRKPTILIECVGRPMLQHLIDIAPPQAHLVMAGAGMAEENFVPLTALMKRLRISFPLGGYGVADFPYIIEMLSTGRLTVDGFITAKIGLDDAPAIFEQLKKPNDHCKIVIKP